MLVNPGVAAPNGAVEAIEREAASKIALANALEDHNRRMKEARLYKAQVERRLAAAITEARLLAEVDGWNGEIRPPPIKPSHSTPSHTSQDLIYLGSDSSDSSDSSDKEEE